MKKHYLISLILLAASEKIIKSVTEYRLNNKVNTLATNSSIYSIKQKNTQAKIITNKQDEEAQSDDGWGEPSANELDIYLEDGKLCFELSEWNGKAYDTKIIRLKGTFHESQTIRITNSSSG